VWARGHRERKRAASAGRYERRELQRGREQRRQRLAAATRSAVQNQTRHRARVQARRGLRKRASVNGVRKRPRSDARVRVRVPSSRSQLRAFDRLARLSRASRALSLSLSHAARRTPHAAPALVPALALALALALVPALLAPSRALVEEARGCAERARELAAVQEADVAVPAASHQPCSRALDGAGVGGWVGLVHPRLEPGGR
jgi:hypothetical protein